MPMNARLRKCALTAHVTSSVGWLGAVAAFQALAVASVMSREPEAVQGFYLGMSVIGWCVILPLCFASLVSGVVVSLGTHWGLFRHYWVLAKFLLTVVAALILLGFTQTLSSLGELAAATPAAPIEALRGLKQSPALHSGGGLLVLLGTTILAVYKPWGLTPYGRTKNTGPALGLGTDTSGAWQRYLALGVICLVLVFLILHLLGGGPRGH